MVNLSSDISNTVECSGKWYVVCDYRVFESSDWILNITSRQFN